MSRDYVAHAAGPGADNSRFASDEVIASLKARMSQYYVNHAAELYNRAVH